MIKEIKNIYFLIVSLLLTCSNLFSQSLVQEEVSTEDLRNEVYKKYNFSEGEGSHEMSLVLFKNNTYKFEETRDGVPRINMGSWKIKDKVLFLKDNINKDKLPISVQFITKADSLFKGFFQIVRNLKGEILNDAMIYVNNDSVQCLALTGTCIGSFKSINRIKVAFENGFTSGWVSIKRKPFEQLSFTILSNYNITNYAALKSAMYLVAKGKLVPKG